MSAVTAVAAIASTEVILDKPLLSDILKWLDSQHASGTDCGEAFAGILKYQPDLMLTFLIRSCLSSPVNEKGYLLSESYLYAIVKSVRSNPMKSILGAATNTTCIKSALAETASSLIDAMDPMTFLVPCLLLQARNGDFDR
jgi:hypothetical protein